MFDFIRTHQRLVMLILLFLILPSFVFFGIHGYDRLQGGGQGVAKVGGQTITEAELDASQREQLQRMQQRAGAGFDPKLFDTPEMRARTLDVLVAQRALAIEAQRSGLGVSDRKLQETIMAIPALQDEGRFSPDRYRSLLAAQGMTPVGFEARLREDLALQRMNGAIQDSVLIPQKVADRIVTIVEQQRDVAQATYKVADFVGQVKLAPDAVQKEYDAHPERYQTPEQVKAHFLVLSPTTLAPQVTVAADAARQYYEQNKKRYEVPEERRARHILIAVAKDASPADRAKARAKAEEVLAKVRANPGDFAKLAKQYSDDPGSAEKGGDLDFLAKGATVPPFEAAMFQLKENQISDLVATDFGFHIIEVTAIKPAVVKSFEQVKGEIDAELAKQAALKKFTDTAEAFSNAVYEQGDTLDPIAKKFGLALQTAENVTRTPVEKQDPAKPLSDPKVIAALFSADSLKTRRNTEAVEIAPNTLVAARVIDYKPAARKPLAEVADAIKSMLVERAAKQLAEQAGKTRLAQLQRGETSGEIDFGAQKTISRTSGSGYPPEVLTEIFKADASKLPAYTALQLPSGDFAIYRIVKVTAPANADAAQRAALTQSLTRQTGALEFDAYLADLRRRAKVQIFAPYADLLHKTVSSGNSQGVP